VTVEGHCDARGTEAYNIALGERRGNLLAYLAQHLHVLLSLILSLECGCLSLGRSSFGLGGRSLRLGRFSPQLRLAQPGTLLLLPEKASSLNPVRTEDASQEDQNVRRVGPPRAIPGSVDRQREAGFRALLTEDIAGADTEAEAGAGSSGSDLTARTMKRFGALPTK